MKNRRMIKNMLHIAGLLCALTAAEAQAQKQVSICKSDDLLRRIHNSSDTTYIVNFWATWCKPCVAELPEFEMFHHSHLGQPVKVILVSMDFKEDLQKRLIPFLEKHNYASEVVLLDEVNGNEFIDKIHTQWSGSIPATLITARNKQKQVFFERTVNTTLLEEELKK